jgi:hypothetical protein
MKNLKYILILAVLTCSATAYGSSKNSFSISISLQPARQPVYIYRSVPVFQRPVVYYTCAQPVYVNRVSVYEQPGFSVSFSTSGGGGHSYYGDHRSHRDVGRDVGRDGGRSGGHDGRRGSGRGHR